MESEWYNYALDVKKVFERVGDRYVVQLCNEILEKFENLQFLGLPIVLGNNHDAFIDEIWNDRFENIGGKSIKFKIDKSKPRKTEMAKIALQKDTIKLLVLNEALFLVQMVMENRKAKTLNNLNNRAYNNEGLSNLVETRTEIKRLLIDGRMDKSFKKFEKHLKNQIETIKDKGVIVNPSRRKKKDKAESEKFKVGLRFATGEAQKIYEETKGYTQTVIQLGWDKSYHGYISATINKNMQPTQKAKNIYADKKLMKIIYDYCIKNNIRMVQDFKENMPLE